MARFMRVDLGDCGNLSQKITTTVLFFAAATILFVYLIGINGRAYLPVFLFFVSVGLMIVTITYQCLGISVTPRFAGVILAEISVASLVFHLIYQMAGYGLAGSDAYIDLASVKSILLSGFVAGVPEYVQLTSYFPIIHILGAELSLVTGIDPFIIARWTPSLISLATIPILYLLVRSLFGRENVALLAALMLASLQHYAGFGSTFVRETIALVLMTACVYFHFSARSSLHPVAYRALAILCLAGVVLGHHLTAMMLVVLLAIHLAVTSASRLPGVRRLFRNIPGRNNVSLSILLLAGIGTFTYWLVVVVEPVRVLSSFVMSILSPGRWGTYTLLGASIVPVPTLRYLFLFYGSYFCYLVFGLILLTKMVSRGRGERIEVHSFTLYLMLCGFTGLAGLYLLPTTVHGDRFLTFGWLFASGPLVFAMIDHRRRWIKGACLSLLVFFMLLNMYTVHPTKWDPNAPGPGESATQEEFVMAQTFGFTEGTTLANMNQLMAIYYFQNVIGTDALFLSSVLDWKTVDWAIVSRTGPAGEALYNDHSMAAMADMEKLQSVGSVLYHKNFESNNLAIFQRNREGD